MSKGTPLATCQFDSLLAYRYTYYFVICLTGDLKNRSLELCDNNSFKEEF
jgi:hypothetical protein